MSATAEEKDIDGYIETTNKAVKLLVAKEEVITIPSIKNAPFDNYSSWFRKKPKVGYWPLYGGNNTEHYFYKGEFIHDFAEGYTFSKEDLISESYGNEDFMREICGEREIECLANNGNTELINKPVYVASSRWGYTNYWHWLLDIIPKILLFAESELPGHGIECIMHAGIESSYQKQWLDIVIEYASKRKVKLIATGKRYVMSKELIWSNSLALPHPSRTLKATFERLINEIKYERKLSDKRSDTIVLMRKKGDVRSIINYDEVVSWANNNFFRVVVAEDYNVIEQISLFANCKILISIHGAGMSNIVFMQKGGKVIELHPDSGFNPAIQDLCAACEINYSLIICKGNGNKQQVKVNTLTLDDAIALK